jgi:hypothetical protein
MQDRGLPQQDVDLLIDINWTQTTRQFDVLAGHCATAIAALPAKPAFAGHLLDPLRCLASNGNPAYRALAAEGLAAIRTHVPEDSVEGLAATRLLYQVLCSNIGHAFNHNAVLPPDSGLRAAAIEAVLAFAESAPADLARTAATLAYSYSATTGQLPDEGQARRAARLLGEPVDAYAAVLGAARRRATKADARPA